MSQPTTPPAVALEPRRTYPLEGGASASMNGGTAAVIAVEGILWHFYFISKLPVAAWLFTSLNAAILISIWLNYRAASRPKIVLASEGLDVWVGRRTPLRIQWSNIERVETATWQTAPDPMVTRGYINSSSPFVPNILITVRRATEIRYFPGVSKVVHVVGFRVDAIDEVVAAISDRVAQCKFGAR